MVTAPVTLTVMTVTVVVIATWMATVTLAVMTVTVDVKAPAYLLVSLTVTTVSVFVAAASVVDSAWPEICSRCLCPAADQSVKLF